MGLNFVRNPWLPVLLLALLAGAAALDLWRVREADQWNTRIRSGRLLDITEAGMPPEALFARAAALDAKGDVEGALNLYKRIEEQQGNAFARDAAYNAATIYLRRATAAGGPSADPQTIPLVELAKEGYRNLLRQSPEDWDARYNLDRALRMQPEDDDEDSGGGNPPIGAERAPTTMRGFTLGLP
jgi:mxaK protein